MIDYKCTHCGYHGPCYGIPHGGGRGHKAGVSAPFCRRCGLNNTLIKVEADSGAASRQKTTADLGQVEERDTSSPASGVASKSASAQTGLKT